MLAQTVLRFQRRGARAHIRHLLKKQHPADVAKMLMELPVPLRGEMILLAGSPDMQADVLSELDAEVAGRIISMLEPEAVVIRIIEGMSSDDAAALLRTFPEDERARLLGLMRNEESEDVEGLLTYRTDTAGAMMTPDIFSLQEGVTVEEAIRALRDAREAREAETVFYIFVVNALEQLVGVISLRQLVVSNPKARLEDIMEREVVTVDAETDREEVARVVEHYNFIAVPVVDEQRHLLGIITVDDVLDVLREEATEDLLRMSGASDLPQRGTSILARLPGRITWMLTATLVAWVISWIVYGWAPVQGNSSDFVSPLSWLVLLPMLIVISITMAMQAAAVAIGAVTLETIPTDAIWPYFVRETGAGITMAVACGGLSTLGLWLMLGLSVAWPLGLSVASGAAVASVLGSGIPLLLHRFHRDPTELGGVIVMCFAAISSSLCGLLVAHGLQ